MSDTRYIEQWFVLCLLIGGAGWYVLGRERTVLSTFSMTWECLHPFEQAVDPGDSLVRFRYVSQPSSWEDESSPGLCEQLKASGKAVVPVQMSLTGYYGSGLDGYRTLTVNGRALSATPLGGGNGGVGRRAHMIRSYELPLSRQCHATGLTGHRLCFHDSLSGVTENRNKLTYGSFVSRGAAVSGPALCLPSRPRCATC